MRLLIIEDEASIMDRLTRLTRRILGCRLGNLDTATTLDEAQGLLENGAFDVLMLDLNLSGKDGFELLKGLTTRSFHTIVVSAHTQRAIEAYELGVVDFVGKPFDEERLAQSFKRVSTMNAERNHFAKYLAVRTLGKVELVPLEKIEYIQADGPCSRIVKMDGLPPWFERTHKSYVANMNCVSGLELGSNHKNFICFASGRKTPISRAKIRALKETLGC